MLGVTTGMASGHATPLSPTAAKVRAARNERGWSQEKLAQEADCSLTTVKRIERGIGEKPRELRSVLRVLGLTPGGGAERFAATGAGVASTQASMGNLAGPQVPSTMTLLEAIRADMVMMAVRNRDPYEVVQALESATPPPGTGVSWWAGHYRVLLEQHGVMPKREGPRK